MTQAETDQHQRTLRSAADLRAAGFVAQADMAQLAEVEARYATAISPAMLALIDRADPADPIARQFVPGAEELTLIPEETPDPIGDHAHMPVDGVVHRYPDRVLLKVTPVCPVYCRFCFRREMVGPGKDAPLSAEKIERALEYIRSDSRIWEVILTGGDPFMLSPGKAAALTRQLDAIEHVRCIRWHTRMPVADPGRIDAAYVAALRETGKAVTVVVHANHARELTEDACAAIARLVDSGVVVLSQSVLLRGVNDSFDNLADLMRAFVANRVRPYYLHQMDFAPGTSHFRVPLDEARALVQRLRDELSGVCQPTFVIDIPGGVSKAVASASDVDLSSQAPRIRGRDGVWRRYPID